MTNPTNPTDDSRSTWPKFRAALDAELLATASTDLHSLPPAADACAYRLFDRTAWSAARCARAIVALTLPGEYSAADAKQALNAAGFGSKRSTFLLELWTALTSLTAQAAGSVSTAQTERLERRAAERKAEAERARARLLPVHKRPLTHNVFADALQSHPLTQEVADTRAGRCGALTSKGGRCKNESGKGTPFCRYHLHGKNRRFGVIDTLRPQLQPKA